MPHVTERRKPPHARVACASVRAGEGQTVAKLGCAQVPTRGGSPHDIERAGKAPAPDNESKRQAGLIISAPWEGSASLRRGRYRGAIADMLSAMLVERCRANIVTHSRASYTTLPRAPLHPAALVIVSRCPNQELRRTVTAHRCKAYPPGSAAMLRSPSAHFLHQEAGSVSLVTSSSLKPLAPANLHRHPVAHAHEGVDGCAEAWTCTRFDGPLLQTAHSRGPATSPRAPCPLRERLLDICTPALGLRPIASSTGVRTGQRACAKHFAPERAE